MSERSSSRRGINFSGTFCGFVFLMWVTSRLGEEFPSAHRRITLSLRGIKQIPQSIFICPQTFRYFYLQKLLFLFKSKPYHTFSLPTFKGQYVMMFHHFGCSRVVLLALSGLHEPFCQNKEMGSQKKGQISQSHVGKRVILETGYEWIKS